jgi:hypothetical protein
VIAEPRFAPNTRSLARARVSRVVIFFVLAMRRWRHALPHGWHLGHAATGDKRRGLHGTDAGAATQRRSINLL